MHKYSTHLCGFEAQRRCQIGLILRRGAGGVEVIQQPSCEKRNTALIQPFHLPTSLSSSSPSPSSSPFTVFHSSVYNAMCIFLAIVVLVVVIVLVIIVSSRRVRLTGKVTTAGKVVA